MEVACDAQARSAKNHRQSTVSQENVGAFRAAESKKPTCAAPAGAEGAPPEAGAEGAGESMKATCAPGPEAGSAPEAAGSGGGLATGGGGLGIGGDASQGVPDTWMASWSG